jgi:MarR family transcriptional regulator, organic hydroperoxide resistance regulator
MQSKHGVTERQSLVIRVVKEFPGISAGDLAQVLCVDISTLSSALNLTTARGFLRLEADARDRRRVRIHLTPKGHQMDRITTDAIEAAVVRTLSEVPAKDQEVTRNVLARLASHLALCNGVK